MLAWYAGLRLRERSLAAQDILGPAAGTQEVSPSLPQEHFGGCGVAQEAQVGSRVAVSPAVEDADQVPCLRAGQGDVVAEHIERRATRSGHSNALLKHPAHAGKVEQRIGLPEHLAHVPRRREVVVHAAVSDDEGLAPRLLYVDDSSDVDAGVGHQVAPQLEEVPASFEARVLAAGGEQSAEAFGEAVKVELTHLLEVGDPEAAAEVDHLKRPAGQVRRLQSDLQNIAAVLEEGSHLEDLCRRVDVDAAQGEFTVGKCLLYRVPELSLVHTELPDSTAHAHPRSHKLGFGIDPESHTDIFARLSRYTGEALDLVYGLDVDGEDTLHEGAP